MARLFYLDDFVRRLNNLGDRFTEDDLGYEETGGSIFYSDDDSVPAVEPDTETPTIGLYAIVASLIDEMQPQNVVTNVNYNGKGLEVERRVAYTMDEVARVMKEWIWRPWVFNELCTRHFEFDHEWFRDDCPGSHNIAPFSDLPKALSLLDVLNVAFVQAQHDYYVSYPEEPQPRLDKIVVYWSRKDRITGIYNNHGL